MKKIRQKHVKIVVNDSKYPKKISAALDNFRFREALSELMNLARAGNKYLAENEPWKIAASDEQRVRTIMNVSLQISANLTVLMERTSIYAITVYFRIIVFRLVVADWLLTLPFNKVTGRNMRILNVWILPD